MVVYMGGSCEDANVTVDDALLIFDANTTCYSVMGGFYSFACSDSGVPEAYKWSDYQCTTGTFVNLSSGCFTYGSRNAHVMCAEASVFPTNTRAVMSAFEAVDCSAGKIADLAIRDTCANAVTPAFAIGSGATSADACDDDDGCLRFFHDSLGYGHMMATCYSDNTILVEIFSDQCDEGYYHARVSPGACLTIGVNYTGGSFELPPPPPPHLLSGTLFHVVFASLLTLRPLCLCAHMSGNTAFFNQYVAAELLSFSFTCLDSAPTEQPPSTPSTLYLGGSCDNATSIDQAGAAFLVDECYEVANGHYTFGCDENGYPIAREYMDTNCGGTYVSTILTDNCFTQVDENSRITCSDATPTSTTAFMGAYTSENCGDDVITYVPLRDSCAAAPSLAVALSGGVNASELCNGDAGCMASFQSDLGYLRIVATCHADGLINVLFYTEDCASIKHNLTVSEAACLDVGTNLTGESRLVIEFLFRLTLNLCLDKRPRAHALQLPQ
ncbi:uncharacterized protein MONBRDRAFT_39319 [Monosiga brevicollis MX1]|uniref:Uncharacterized protein n=1 Tax=Monosiga brevicollis TaxID=81824 RepID=A9VDQ9_MONBE|nr:uncharacterized protein MONBRDRAFT_39319 [Monosiga brevicollis MX1]EDQ84345.1 predicted protein [Monosiga brevicollis MX1]|eukprot:XP_001750841.1 hypothetical protein [Monosiga brevicollis MX1]